MLRLDDSSESEIALDSLGSFFNYLVDTDYSQDNTGASKAIEEEVTIISSDSVIRLQRIYFSKHFCSCFGL